MFPLFYSFLKVATMRQTSTDSSSMFCCLGILDLHKMTNSYGVIDIEVQATTKY